MKLNVVKVGGAVIDDPQSLSAFLDAFVALEGPKVLIHGGGREATKIAAGMGVESQMINGRRVTDKATLDIVTMVYAGLVNKRIVSMLQVRGCNAIGLSGADGDAIRATRRPAKPIDFGYVGDIVPADVNATIINKLLECGLVPVFNAITHDGNGQLLNCNADTIARSVASGMAGIREVTLTFCFEMPGVLRDVNNPDSVISVISKNDYSALVEQGIIAGGMLPKIDNAFDSISHGVKTVSIRHWKDLAKSGAGTDIVA